MREDFRARLRSRDTLLGTMVTLASAATAEMLADIGFDWLFIDAGVDKLLLGAAAERLLADLRG